MADCGVLADPSTEREIAHFGYCSFGWRLPALVSEIAGGQVGIEVARMLGLEPALNPDYTPEGEALLMGSDAPPRMLP